MFWSRELTKREEKALIRHTEKDLFTSGPQMVSIVATRFNKQVHPELCRGLLRKHGSNARVSRRKPLVSKRNKVLRAKYAKEFIDKDDSFWSTVLFSEESKFE